MTDPTAEPPGHDLRVLIVDDDPIGTALLESHLAACGHAPAKAASAAEAMAVLDREPVHLVIADWVMPGMSGLDLCRWVRRRRFAGPMHFVMLTAHSDLDRLIEAFDAGADDFLSKPLHAAELSARVRAWGRFLRLQMDLAARHDAEVRLNERLSRANTDLANANARLAELATVDELTGLPNRRLAMRRLDEHLAAARAAGTPLACAMADVDRFKEINDAAGHAAGDEALRNVAAALRRGAQPPAGPARPDAVFRIGGDEFLMLFPGETPAAAAAGVARCRAAIADQARAGLRTPQVSVGIAALTPEMVNPQALLAAADQALYAAKPAGKAAASAKASPPAKASAPPGTSAPAARPLSAA